MGVLGGCPVKTSVDLYTYCFLYGVLGGCPVKTSVDLVCCFYIGVLGGCPVKTSVDLVYCFSNGGTWRLSREDLCRVSMLFFVWGYLAAVRQGARIPSTFQSLMSTITGARTVTSMTAISKRGSPKLGFR